MLKLASHLLLMVLIIIHCNAKSQHLIRQRRSFFVFPMGGIIKLITGISIPVKLGLKQSLNYGLNIQYQYRTAQNYSEFEVYPPIVSRGRDTREIETSDRALFYQGLESLMNRYGINGTACVLRSICDNAMDSLSHDVNGLYGHLLHIILTPSYGDDEIDQNLSPVYFEAQRAGEYGVDCISLYPLCPYGHGILDFVSLTDF